MRWIPACAAGVISAAFAISLAGQSRTAEGSDAKRFIGTWRLVGITQGNRQLDPNRGAHPTGLIYHDSTGHMAAQIMADQTLRRRFVAEQPTGNEAQQALRTYTAYFGTYTVDERTHTVTHHREGHINPGALGDFVRRYEFLPDGSVVLTPVENPNENRIVWQRIGT